MKFIRIEHFSEAFQFRSLALVSTLRSEEMNKYEKDEVYPQSVSDLFRLVL